MQLIIHQNCLRETFLTGILQLNSLFADDELGQQKKAFEPLMNNIRDALKERCGLTADTANLVLQHPETMLWDNLFPVLSQFEEQKKIAQIVVMLHKEKSCPV